VTAKVQILCLISAGTIVNISQLDCVATHHTSGIGQEVLKIRTLKQGTLLSFISKLNVRYGVKKSSTCTTTVLCMVDTCSAIPSGMTAPARGLEAEEVLPFIWDLPEDFFFVILKMRLCSMRVRVCVCACRWFDE